MRKPSGGRAEHQRIFASGSPDHPRGGESGGQPEGAEGEKTVTGVEALIRRITEALRGVDVSREPGVTKSRLVRPPIREQWEGAILRAKDDGRQLEMQNPPPDFEPRLCRGGQSTSRPDDAIIVIW